MKTHIFYHSADKDGHCSGAIANHFALQHKMSPILHPIDHGEVFPWGEINPEDQVWMLDFSLPIDDMNKLKNSCEELIWIDHHDGILRDYEQSSIGPIKGIRDRSIAACELTWKFLFPEKRIPNFISLLSEYDVGRFLKEICPIEEVFVPINGFEGIYSISTLGKVRSERTSEIMFPSYNNAGYLQVILSKNGKTKPKQIHSLVAETFLIQPKGCNEINHIDGNKSNNILTNLEWSNRILNADHALKIGLKHCATPYYGVSYIKNRNKYSARVTCFGQREVIGRFKSAISAAEAYDKFVTSKGLHRSPHYVPLNFEESEKPERKTIFYNPRAEPFNHGLELVESDPSKNWNMWIEWFNVSLNEDLEDEWIDSTCVNGSHISRYLLLECTKNIEEFSYEIDWEGYRCLVINSDPRVINYMTRSSKFDHCDIAINYSDIRGERWNVNLRAKNPNINLSLLAKKYGGGGHRSAAGFSWKERLLPWDNYSGPNLGFA